MEYTSRVTTESDVMAMKEALEVSDIKIIENESGFRTKLKSKKTGRYLWAAMKGSRGDFLVSYNKKLFI
jgi:hypothetical protein